jgi:peptide/nickel transport system permease protein
MDRYRHFLKRALQGIPVLIGLSVLVFVLTRVVPGNPVRLALGPGATDEQVAQLREQLGFNDPLYVQYIDWVTGLVQGNWGMSLRTESGVLSDILFRLPATFELVLVTMVFAICIAIPLGVIGATNKDRWPDHGSRLLALFGVSMPSFWVAIVLQVVFATVLNWFPIQGRLSDGVAPPPEMTHLYLVDSLLAGQWNTFLNAAHHLMLPALALSLGTVAQVTRLIRSDMIEEQRSDYVQAATAYGLPRNLTQYKYMLKNAFTNTLTVIGLAFGFLMGNAFLVEIVFSWPGFAKYGVNAITFQDTNGITGVVMVVGIIFVFVNVFVDILYGYLDPRIFMEDR